MTAETIGADLLQALLAELRLLPKPWDQLASARQHRAFFGFYLGEK